MSEGQIQDRIRLVLSDAGIVAWRNNTGFDEQRRVRYGLCVGSSDLIAILPGGRFAAIEIKTATGRLSKEQRMFAELVTLKGGVFVVLRSEEEAREWLRTL